MWMLTASAAYATTFGLGLTAGVQPGTTEKVTGATRVDAANVSNTQVGEGLEPGGAAFKALGLRAPISLELGPRSALRLVPAFTYGAGKTSLSGAGVATACTNLAALGAVDEGAAEGCVLASTAWRVSGSLLAAPEIRTPFGGPAWGYLAPGVGLDLAKTFQDTDYGPWNGCEATVRVNGDGCSGSADLSPKAHVGALLDLAAGVMLRPESGPGTWFELAYTRTWDPGGAYPAPEGGPVSVDGYRYDLFRLGIGVLFGQSG